jgi:hypothetical protein
MPRPSRDHAISSVRLKGIGASDGDNAFQKRLADEACLLRGKIIAGYSLVEYVLADISVRLDLKFPYRTKDRGPPARSTASCASCSRSTSTHRRGARALRNTATDSLREFVDAGIGERRFLLAVFLIPPGRRAGRSPRDARADWPRPCKRRWRSGIGARRAFMPTG